MDNSASYSTRDEEKGVSMKSFLTLCLSRWRWFALSVILFVAIGMLIVLRKQPVYSRSCAVLITDQDGGGGGGVGDIAGAFASMGLVSSGSNVNNELIALTTPAVMFEVVNRLDLTTEYSRKTPFYWETLYGTNLPLLVSLPDFPKDKSGMFKIELEPDGSGRLYDFVSYVEGEASEHDVEFTFGPGMTGEFKSPLGRLILSPNPDFKGKITEQQSLKVWKSTLQTAVEQYLAAMEGERREKDAEVIDLTIDDVSIQRANDILNTIVAVYNENWVEDKNRIAVATSSFIDERLKLIEHELGEVDDDISDYKTKHLLTDLQASASLAMTQAAKQSDEILAVTNQLAMATYLREYLNDRQNRFNVIPVNTGFGNLTLESQIAQYNTMLLSRNTLEANSSPTNPIVMDYDTQLSGMREAIVRAVNTQIATLGATLKNMQKSQGESENQLASAPGQAKYLLSVERQQKVKESLYLYLLQKREENELTQTFTAYNTRVIQPPFGSLTPIAPKKSLTILAMFLLGLAVPAVAIYMIAAGDDKVRTRKDLERVAVPFTGEIPYAGKKNTLRRLIQTKKQRQAAIDKPFVIVEEGNRNAVNEAFRLIRSNIQLMVGKDNRCPVIMLTSCNPGSGKSFITFNLGVSFAIKGKRTLIIDGDLRHGSLSMYVNSPSRGLSAYLNESTDDWQGLVRNVPGYKDLDILPIGHRPPNPAELLENGRLAAVMEGLKKDYDIILIDCPPIDIVVDTQIIGQYVDRTIFVIRAGLLDRNQLAQVASLYQERKYPRMSMILNGVDHGSDRSYYGGYYSTVDTGEK
ncbi:MAG: polysaccharide biosynthesis tyrosine autokinase [Muribaculaceae bacterium]|nr:polysaccharide biosynthesis tyrosine autokinase [Muribaculaceae bacterium]